MSDAAATAEQLASVADEAAEAGSAYLRDRFEDGPLDAEYTAMDVKTAADVGAEERILEVIGRAYPDHAISTEESGEHPGDGAYRWVVDPLDGTNNFAIGLPTFAVGVTALEVAPSTGEDDDPLATAVHVPVLDESYVARRGSGVTHREILSPSTTATASRRPTAPSAASSASRS